MIRLIDMLDRLRRRANIPYTNLSVYLGISTTTLRNMMHHGNIANEHIKLWCEFLELHIQDYLPLYQYNERERIYNSLPGIPEGARRLITDIKYFHSKLDCTAIHHKLLKEILPHIHGLPHTFKNVHAEIKNREIP